MMSCTAGTSASRTMFSRPRYLMLGSRTLMNLPSRATLDPSSSASASRARASATASKTMACWALFLFMFLATSVPAQVTRCAGHYCRVVLELGIGIQAPARGTASAIHLQTPGYAMCKDPLPVTTHAKAAAEHMSLIDLH